MFAVRVHGFEFDLKQKVKLGSSYLALKHILGHSFLIVSVSWIEDHVFLISEVRTIYPLTGSGML